VDFADGTDGLFCHIASPSMPDSGPLSRPSTCSKSLFSGRRYDHTCAEERVPEIIPPSLWLSTTVGLFVTLTLGSGGISVSQYAKLRFDSCYG
jgi:hypothetical protein